MNEDQHRTRQAEPRLGERLMEATRKLRSAIGGAARLKIYRPAQRWSQALKAISRLGPKRARGHEDTVVATRVGRKPRLLGIRSEWSIAPRANWKALVDREPTERTAGSVARKNAVSLRTSKTPGRGRDEWPRKGRHVQPKSLIADAASMYHLLGGRVVGSQNPQIEAARSAGADEHAFGAESKRSETSIKPESPERKSDRSLERLPEHRLSGQIARAIGLAPGIADSAAPKSVFHRYFPGADKTLDGSSATGGPQRVDAVAAGEQRRQIDRRDVVRRTIAGGDGPGPLRELTTRLVTPPENAARANSRQSSHKARSREAGVVHYAPTVVINNSSQAVDLERRILAVMARSGHELSEILRREAARQERTTF